MDELAAREAYHRRTADLQALAARDPGFGRLLGHAMTGASLLSFRDNGKLDERDIHELAARDPGFGRLLGHAMTGATLLSLRDGDHEGESEPHQPRCERVGRLASLVWAAARSSKCPS